MPAALGLASGIFGGGATSGLLGGGGGSPVGGLLGGGGSGPSQQGGGGGSAKSGGGRNEFGDIFIGSNQARPRAPGFLEGFTQNPVTLAIVVGGAVFIAAILRR